MDPNPQQPTSQPPQLNPNQPMDPVTPPNQPPLPPLDTDPVPTTPVVVQKKSKKKAIIIALVAVFLVLAGGAAVFSLWYNNPQNVVGDSFMKLATAKSSEGTMVLVAPDEGVTNNVAVAYAQNEANELSGTLAYTTEGDGPKYDVKAAYAVDKDQTAYVKIENLRKSIDTLNEADPEGAIFLTLFDGIIDSVDGKWISFSEADLQKLSGEESESVELSCVQEKIGVFQTDKAQQNEVRDLYTKNPFIDVTQVGTETVDGVYSNHYQLKPNDAKAKEFFAGTKNLTVFKNIDGCVEQDLGKEVDDALKEESSNDESKSTDTIDYWVNVLSHEPVKLKFTSVENDETSSLEFKPKLNTNPTVTIPKADKTIIELQEELMASYSGLFEPEPLDDL